MEAIQQEIYQLIGEAFLHFHEDYLRVSEQLGLTLFQFWTLIHLEDPEGLSPSVLAHLVLCDKSSVTHVVDDLEAKPLVVREHRKQGGRRFQRIVSPMRAVVCAAIFSERFANAARLALSLVRRSTAYLPYANMTESLSDSCWLAK